MKIKSFFKIAIMLLALSTTLNAQEVAILTADVASSTISWKGYKTMGSHEGTIELQSGNLMMDGDAITGSFIAKMSTIKHAGGNAKLEKHLKSKDFFDIEVFTTSKFEITGTEKKDEKLYVTGNLSIKDITKEITFPAAITKGDGMVTLTSETFQINRVDYNIQYKSKNFLNNLKEKFIKDEFDLKVSIVVKK
jgi:polyisoprenoid-binding protein YceI